MSYCHKCGKKSKDDDSFCGMCGAKVKEVIQEIEEEVSKIVPKKSHKGLIVFIILILIFGYIALDIWALSQLRPVLSVNSIMNSVSNLDGDVSLTSSKASTTIRVENPTFVPVIGGKVVYDAGYGDTKVAEGGTGLILIGPYSETDLPADVRVSHTSGIVSLGKSLWDAISGNQQQWNANAYIDIGITKFKVRGYG